MCIRDRFLALGLLLVALQQADYRMFTANSKALSSFAVQHPRAIIVGTTNNSSLGNLWARLVSPGSPRAVILSFRDLNEEDGATHQKLSEADAIFAVLDQQLSLIHI